MMPQPEKMPINQRLRKERLQRHWSQQELADLLGTTVISIKRWERNITIPNPYFRLKLTALFSKSAEELGLLKEEALQTPKPKAEISLLTLEDSNTSYNPLFSTEKVLDLPTPSVAEQESIIFVRPTLREQSQTRMIELVSTIWITGMLEQSLHGAVLQTLGLYEQPHIVDNPWCLTLQEMQRSAQLLPAGTSIVQAYDAIGGHLLILGDPGSGKTTILLELAQKLLNRARQEPEYPIPVIFNLSSWAIKRQSLEAWMIEELQEKYQVSHILSKQWMTTNTIIPLLDGLDEVTKSRRSACVEAINYYLQDHGLMPTVVCSRHVDYISMHCRIRLRSAVVLQPLRPQQITNYLADFNEKVEGLRCVLDEDEELQKLATTPFMLNILTLTYTEASQKDVLTVNTQEDRRRYIFEQYVERVLKHRSPSHLFTPLQFMDWLIVLAKQLTEHQETVFYIERIQFDWFSSNRTCHLLPIVCLGLIQGLFIGIAFIFFCLLFHSIKSTLIIVGVLVLWNAGFSILLNGCILEWFHPSKMRDVPMQHISLFQVSIKLLKNRLIYGIVFAILNSLVIGFLFGSLSDLHLALQETLKYAVFYGCLLGYTFLVQGPILPIIQLTERVIWSWKTVRQDVLKYVMIIVAVGFIFRLIYPLTVDMFLILFAIVGAIITASISRRALEPDQRSLPNQSTRRSGRNCFQTDIIAGVFTIVILSVSFGCFYGPLVGLLYSLTPALIVAFCFVLQRRGTPYLLHFIVRGLLWWEGKLPWHYTHFLDEAVDRIILRKVDGGYIFIHRYVLEYFASLERIEPTLTNKRRQST